jgi:hypothetical protein
VGTSSSVKSVQNRALCRMSPTAAVGGRSKASSATTGAAASLITSSPARWMDGINFFGGGDRAGGVSVGGRVGCA